MPIRGSALLVVDPDMASGLRLAGILEAAGGRVRTCECTRDALGLLNAQLFELVFSELTLPDAAAPDFLRALQERWPDLPVIAIARGASAGDAVAAVKAGAADFIEKPFHDEQVRFVLEKVLLGSRSALQSAPKAPPGRPHILGRSPAIRHAQDTLQRVAGSSATVLIRGETGSGKELMARAIHEASPRADQPFIKIDCAALPEGLLESELFGYERGAFTGAVSRKLGRVELADKGTLFLDEVGELSLLLQAKLLRLLQDRQLERLGGNRPISVDIRLLAATHRDLEGMTERGQFRFDLFSRLNVVPLWIPPLRARRDDIPELARHFVAVTLRENRLSPVSLDESALAALRAQRWPGNVRQLQNFVERLVILSATPVITREHVDTALTSHVAFKTESTDSPGHDTQSKDRQQSDGLSTQSTDTEVHSLENALRIAEKQAIERALTRCQGNRSLAARLLGVSRSTLYAKLHEHGLLTSD